MQKLTLTDYQTHKLSCAVIAQAIQDWRKLIIKKRAFLDYNGVPVSFVEIREFFLSEYCAVMLSDSLYSGHNILRWLEEEKTCGKATRMRKSPK